MSTYELNLISTGTVAVDVDEYGITLSCESGDHGCLLNSTLTPTEAREIAAALTRAADNDEEAHGQETEWCSTPGCVRPVSFHPDSMHLTEDGHEFGTQPLTLRVVTDPDVTRAPNIMQWPHHAPELWSDSGQGDNR